MTTSEIENDQNDLDPNDHVGTTQFILQLTCPYFSTRQYVSVSVFIQEEAGCAY